MDMAFVPRLSSCMSKSTNVMNLWCCSVLLLTLVLYRNSENPTDATPQSHDPNPVLLAVSVFYVEITCTTGLRAWSYELSESNERQHDIAANTDHMKLSATRCRDRRTSAPAVPNITRLLSYDLAQRDSEGVFPLSLNLQKYSRSWKSQRRSWPSRTASTFLSARLCLFHGSASRHITVSVTGALVIPPEIVIRRDWFPSRHSWDIGQRDEASALSQPEIVSIAELETSGW
ncbi:hypothetical protein WG66_013649 [Moniliophthora roreri]|nr:hypothetical protein WG66_013649 [Moniliophthora roreri]